MIRIIEVIPGTSCAFGYTIELLDPMELKWVRQYEPWREKWKS
jgi:hypothetical protein